jgi:2'-hydroxyisoflavone reductase
MRILVLGGTSFVGRAIVEQALTGGHEVTLFGRGRTGAELFPAVERRTGDRDTGDYAALAGDAWDAAVDVSGYLPRHVGQAMDGLGERIGRYLFISTGAVYDQSYSVAGADESAPLRAPERGTEEIDDDTYGSLKVACENDVTTRYGERATIVRPGIVAGPHDPTDRFTWWVRRAARGGRVALPGWPEQPVQVVDSGDLARLVIALLADDRPGAFNAIGPAEPATIEELIQAAATAAGTSVEVVPIAADAVSPALPLLLSDPNWGGRFRRSAAAARAVGLTGTPLVQTAADTLAWDRERGQPPLSTGISPEVEAELLATAGRD